MNHIPLLFSEIVAYSGNTPQEYKYIKIKNEWKKALLQIVIAVFSLFLIPLFYHIKKHTELNRKLRKLEKENSLLKNNLIIQKKEIECLKKRAQTLQKEANKKLRAAQENVMSLAQQYYSIDRQNKKTILLCRDIYRQFQPKTPPDKFLLPHSEDSTAIRPCHSW